MTRENKLALVIGFGLILFVGILVSDHFSAQRYDVAKLSPDSTSTEPAGVDLTPLTQPEVLVAQNTGEVITLGGAPTGGSESGAAGGTDPQQGLPITVAQGDDANGDPVRFHKVQAGETLWKIAAKEYGDGSLCKELAEYNKTALNKGDRLSLNQELRLPSVEKLRPTLVASTGPANAAGAQTPTSVVADARTHTIAKGDTVYQIARRYNVKPQAIMAANGIRDASALKPGQSIKIPGSSSSF